jgi:lambda repressor-like predicted transcriptional regulator
MNSKEIIAKLQSQGVSLAAEGDKLRWSAPKDWPTPERVEYLRVHKADILACLNEASKQDASESVGESKTYTRLELAWEALAKLIPDAQAQRRIRAIAEADARNWRFLGTAGYQHILAGNIMDQIEKATGKLICFKGTDDVDKFAGWFVREVQV